MKEFCHIFGPILVLLGTVVGVIGTYKMTKFYHRFGILHFLRSVWRVMWLVVIGDKPTIVSIFRAAPGLAGKENRAVSAAGIYILFVGFLLQSVGALLVVIDAILPEKG